MTDTITSDTLDELTERADNLFDRLNAMPVTAANTHVRATMQAELDELTEQIATESRRARRLAAEINAAADQWLKMAETLEVRKVTNYRHRVDTIDEGRAFLRAGVESGSCSWMAVLKITDGDKSWLEVVDAEGGRGVDKMCRKLGMSWRQVDERATCQRAVAA